MKHLTTIVLALGLSIAAAKADVASSSSPPSPLAQPAMQNVAAGKYQDAINECDQGLATNPNDLMLLMVRGTAYQDVHKYQEALQDFTKILNLGVRKKEVYCSREMSYLNLNQYQNAVDDCDEAIKLGATR